MGKPKSGKGSAKGGRPTLLTAGAQAKLCEAIELGAHFEHACSYAGIHYHTLLGWVHRGETGEEPFAGFLDALKAAEARGAIENLRAIRDAKEGTPGVANATLWANRAWILERRHPRLYGRTVTEVINTGKAQVTEDDTARIRELLEKANARRPTDPVVH